MDKLTNEEYAERLIELEKVFYNKLNLKDNMNEEELPKFYQNILNYLKHGRGKELVGRTPEMLENKIDYFINFGISIGLDNKEIISCIERFPNILNIMDDKFIYKYIFLSVIENDDNTLRKTKLVADTEDFEVSLETIYSRYRLMNELKYTDINWSNLVHESHSEFIKKFVKSKYYKPYKIFENPEEMSSLLLKEKYPVNYEFINELKTSELNNFGGISGNIRKK